MIPETQNHDVLTQRIARLEKEVRWIKRAGMFSFAALAIIVLAFHLRGHYKLTADTMVARVFVLANSSDGPAARMTNFPEGSGLEIYAANGERRVQLIGGGEQAALSLYTPVTSNHSASLNLVYENRLMSSLRSDHAGSVLELHSGTANGVANGSAVLSLHRALTSFTLNGNGETVPKISMEADAAHACETLGDYSPAENEHDSDAGLETPSPVKGVARASLCIHSPGFPALNLRDLSGDHAILGTPEIADSEGSAASLVLRQKNGKSLHLEPH